jgi:predicted metal-binding membrane protein
MTTAVEAALRRQRAVTIAALALLTLMAWAWLLLGAGMAMAPRAELHLFPRPAAGDMTGMAMPSAEWSAGQWLLAFSMWWVMMVAMMLPAAAPVILLYARAAAVRPDAPRPATGSFLAGYLIVWGAFYQLSQLKEACLAHCRNPAVFLSRHYRRGRTGAWRMGAIHGAYCLGCCWLLMALLFVGGVMNLAWIALLSLLVAGEKLLPGGRRLGQAAGLGFIAWGALVAFA